MACSSARWFRQKGLEGLVEGLTLFERGRKIIQWLGVSGFFENPKSPISSYYREPDYKFHPSNFTWFEPQDNYSKETWLWAYNGFVMPRPKELGTWEKPDDRIHKCPPSENRSNFRSKFPADTSQAIFEANRPY